MWLALIAIALVTFACAVPYTQVLTFKATDSRLLRALNLGRNQLIGQGIKIAQSIVITNQGSVGIPVRFAETIDKLQEYCADEHPDLNGCTAYRDRSYNIEGMWLRKSLSDPRLAAIVLHEMIHALFPGIEHLEPGQTGIFTLEANSLTLTSADMTLLAQYAEIDNVDSLVSTLGENR